MASFTLITTLKGTTDLFGGINCVCVTSDGSRLLAGANDGFIRVWDMGSFSLINSFRAHNFSVTCMCVSPDGSRIVSGSTERTIKLWGARR